MIGATKHGASCSYMLHQSHNSFHGIRHKFAVTFPTLPPRSALRNRDVQLEAAIERIKDLEAMVVRCVPPYRPAAQCWQAVYQDNSFLHNVVLLVMVVA
jgi:hypothetical protein